MKPRAKVLNLRRPPIGIVPADLHCIEPDCTNPPAAGCILCGKPLCPEHTDEWPFGNATIFTCGPCMGHLIHDALADVLYGSPDNVHGMPTIRIDRPARAPEAPGPHAS